MKDRVAACIYPDSTSCRGCSYSFNPALFDGAVCSNMERRGIANLYSRTSGQRRGNATKKIAKSNGGYTPERIAGHE